MSNLPAIGSKILVGFPQHDLKNVPAKVDTGAYTSSVWASNFNEHDGVLEFTLFAEGSPFYSGEVIATKDYRITPIKSSFGHSELRYMVKLKLKIGRRIVKATFSLADRSANRYPILIGRRTLKGKFVVDVTKNTIKDVYRVLVLDYKSIGSVTRFFERIQMSEARIDFTLATHSQLVFQLDNNQTRVSLSANGMDVSEFDLVFIKSIMADKQAVVALAKYLDGKHIPYMDRANSFYPLNNKLAQYIELSHHGIPVPKSMFVASDSLKANYESLSEFLGTPFVLKDIGGSKGRDNYLIKSAKDYKKAIKKTSKRNLNMIGQEYIENDGDYRVLVFGEHIRLVIYRRKGGKSHLNNTSAGGTAQLISANELPESVRQMSLKAAGLLKLDVAGVDMMQALANGAWYCLEVNHGPQITSGAFVRDKQEKFADFLKEKLEKGL